MNFAFKCSGHMLPKESLFLCSELIKGCAKEMNEKRKKKSESESEVWLAKLESVENGPKAARSTPNWKSRTMIRKTWLTGSGNVTELLFSNSGWCRL